MNRARQSVQRLVGLSLGGVGDEQLGNRSTQLMGYPGTAWHNEGYVFFFSKSELYRPINRTFARSPHIFISGPALRRDPTD